jgi:hypothetical protein
MKKFDFRHFTDGNKLNSVIFLPKINKIPSKNILKTQKSVNYNKKNIPLWCESVIYLRENQRILDRKATIKRLYYANFKIQRKKNTRQIEA